MNDKNFFFKMTKTIMWLFPFSEETYNLENKLVVFI